MYFIILTAAKV